MYNLINIAELAGFRIADIVLGSITEMMYVLTPEQLKKGACHVNIGKGMTTVTVVHSGKIISSVSLSMGGQDVTKQISESLKIDEQLAEKLKLNFGEICLNASTAEIVYADEVEGQFTCITRQMLSDSLTVKYETILKLVKQYLVENCYKYDQMDYIFTGCKRNRGLNLLAKKVFHQDITVCTPMMLGLEVLSM